jgi:hypothetical protein
VTEGARGRSWLSHAVIGVWLGAYLAWTQLDPLNPQSLQPAAEPQANESEARVSVRAQPEPRSSAALPATSAPARPAPAPAEPSPRPIGAFELTEGARVLDGAAPFPVLSADYQAFESFSNYARAMSALGARFVVLHQREIVASADLEHQTLAPVGSLGGFSPRARSYSDEPGLARLQRRARDRFGKDAGVAMLVPRGLDAGLFGGIARALAERGLSPDTLSEIRGRYEPGPAGGARFRVEAAVRKDGSLRSLDWVFDLHQIARAQSTRGSA